jgi:hypothetical protein
VTMVNAQHWNWKWVGRASAEVDDDLSCGIWVNLGEWRRWTLKSGRTHNIGLGVTSLAWMRFIHHPNHVEGWSISKLQHGLKSSADLVRGFHQL